MATLVRRHGVRDRGEAVAAADPPRRADATTSRTSTRTSRSSRRSTTSRELAARARHRPDAAHARSRCRAIPSSTDVEAVVLDRRASSTSASSRSGRGATPFLDWWAERLAPRLRRSTPRAGCSSTSAGSTSCPSLLRAPRRCATRPATSPTGTCTSATFDVDGTAATSVDGAAAALLPLQRLRPEQAAPPQQAPRPEPRDPAQRAARAAARSATSTREQLRAAGYDEATSCPTASDQLPNGMTIDEADAPALPRGARRGRAATATRAAQPVRAARARPFVDWLREPDGPPGAPVRVPRYLRPCPRGAAPTCSARFPDPRATDGDALSRVGMAREGRVEERIPVELAALPGSRAARSARRRSSRRRQHRRLLPTPRPGSARRPAVLARRGRAGRDPAFGGRRTTRLRAGRHHAFARASATSRAYDVNVICVNADQLPRFDHDVGPDFFRGPPRDRDLVVGGRPVPGAVPRRLRARRTRSGWEATSSGGRSRRETATSRCTMLPLGDRAAAERLPASRADARPARGLPLPLLVRFRQRRFERKNPLGLIEAFRAAFDPDEGPALVIKTINGDRHARASSSGCATPRRPRGHPRRRRLPRRRRRRTALIVRVRLLRLAAPQRGLRPDDGRGHGAGKPVIATGYSGNLEFMDDGEQPARAGARAGAPSGPGHEPYPDRRATGPSRTSDVAAALMRRAVDERPTKMAELGRRARTDVLDRFSLDRTAAFLTERLDRIHVGAGRKRADGPEPRSPPWSAPPGG